MTTTRPLRVIALALLVTLIVIPGLVPLPAVAGVVPPIPPAIPPGSADALAVTLGPTGGPLFFLAIPEGPIESIVSPLLPTFGAIPLGTFTAFLTEPGTTDISDQIIVVSDGNLFTVSLFSDPLVPVTPCVTPSCVPEDGTFQLMNAALGLPPGPIFIFAFSDIGDRIPDVPGVTPLALIALGLGALGLARARRRTA
jgi:hypothetical protein